MISSQAARRQLSTYVKIPTDPGLGALRRATRAAIVIPLVFAFADLLLREPQILIFVVFGCFSLLVISDFGGARPQRALAYLFATVFGALLVALGTLASSSTWLAVGVMFLIGFTISFSRVFGGYVAAANIGMLLSFVVAVTIPAPATAIAERLGGWAIAGLVSTVAAVALWPRFERIAAYQQVAKALGVVADLIEGVWSGSGGAYLSGVEEQARQAVQVARQSYAAANRPTATERRDRAFMRLFIELDRILEIVERPFNEGRPEVRPGLSEGEHLVATVVAGLRSSAKALTGGSEPDVDEIELARTRHRAALDKWAAEQLQAGRPTEEVLDGLDFDDTFRVVSYLTFLLGGNAIIAAGARPDARDTLIHVLRTIRAHLESPSTVLQGSLRVAIGLALAVWVARAFDLSHAFWVVLGTIQVLRSNALGTGRTIVQAVAGNVIGVIIGGLFAVLAGNHLAIMWIAFPIAVFGAAYAATTIGFAASQAAFTINLIVVFNLISPVGWQVGLLRIEDLLVGASISLVVGILLWPRGAHRELTRALANVYRGLVPYLDHAFDRVLGLEPVGPVNPARSTIARAQYRVDAALETLRSEPGSDSFDRQTAMSLLASTDHAIFTGDILEVIAGGMGYRADSCAEGARQVHDQLQTLLDRYRRLADRLRLSTSVSPRTDVSIAALRQAALGCLRQLRAHSATGKGAMAVVMATEWMQDLTRVEGDLDEAVTAVVATAQRPWWR